MLELIIDGVCMIEGDHHWAVILQEKGADRYLPIFLCPEEAKIIAIKLQGGDTERPLIHELMCRVISSLGGSLLYTMISDFRDQVAYAQVALQAGNGLRVLACRPSDAVNLAVQGHVPIFVEEEILDEAGWAFDRKHNLFLPLNVPGPAETTSKVEEAELQRLSAFAGLVQSLDLEDFGSPR